MNIWDNPENIETLKRLWGTMTARQIAEHIPGADKYKVAYKARSLALCAESRTNGAQLMGALPGENAQDRRQRVLAYMAAHPDMCAAEVSRRLLVPLDACRRAKAEDRIVSRGRKSPQRNIFQPVQRFTPSLVPPTVEERLAAIPPDELEAIAARYGASVRRAA